MEIVRTNEINNKTKGQNERDPICQKDTMPKKYNTLLSLFSFISFSIILKPLFTGLLNFSLEIH